MKKALLLQKIDEAGMKLLADANIQADIAENTDAASLMQIVPEYDAIIVRGMIPLSGEVIKKALKCKVISRHGVGLDTIDIIQATALNIPVAYTPGANANAVAEQTVSLMLDIVKKTVYLSSCLMRDKNYQCRMGIENSELRGKTLGLVGLGNIGQRVAKICRFGFGMNIIGLDPFVNKEQFDEMKLEGELTTDLAYLLKNADIVSLHTPGANTPLIGVNELAQMKKGSILINTARGSLIHEVALYNSLVSGHLMGAGLDVTADEPPKPDNQLFSLNNVVVTPHIAALTKEGNINMAVGAAQQVIDVFAGKIPWGLANKEIWDTRR